MVTGDSVRGIEDLRAYWQKIKQLLGENGEYTASVNPDELSLISGDIALSKGSTQEVAVTGAGKRYEFSSQWTAVCRKEDGQWKLLRVQATMDPVSNVFVKAFLRRTAAGSGLAGAAVGLVAGALLAGFLLRRRRATQPGVPST
jgi:ketosteroid isomerase-like protein